MSFIDSIFFILRITCQRPNPLYIKPNAKNNTELIDTLFLRPDGKGWNALLNFLYDNRDKMTANVLPHIVVLVDEWCNVINIHDELPEEAKVVGLISLWLLESIKDSYED
ncbi:hypothetical protein LGZ99_10845 [Photorhabdus temperata]|uniref:Uncharacterized protein n=3 Tax=Photorhabdus temperata TaxID=574560 RepID=A0A081RZA8_PHOTE|nr:hypothetical protein [Photorhabdus temperata]ERT12283.1 hypothetical protein O185_14920 [Photorhabdus temperata J3]KER04011.1 hypothetical protein MEG1DRAFT_01291 [Photorhabdus temperata subsp. temperata Meg1]MCT8347697.1 hypothetical protein [Photorhabdus temperata]